MPKLRFLSDAVIDVTGGTETLFRSGEVQTLNKASAFRWVRRGVAVEIPESVEIPKDPVATSDSAPKRLGRPPKTKG